MGSRRKGKDEAAAASTVNAPVEPAPSVDEQPQPEERLFLGQYALPPAYTKQAAMSLSVAVIAGFICLSYYLRVRDVSEFGGLLHSSDPWFNYRAAEYMSQHGWKAFFRWFDYMSWYPLGRPVGSTTYPGLQFTAVAIHRTLAALGMDVPLYHVCLMIPAWFSVVACVLLLLLSYEIAHSLSVSVLATILFAIVPAHLMRSMAGEFDNECIAVSAMLLTFYLWVRSLRTPASWPLGALVGVAYGYMVAAWGGYIFVLNMIALHAGVSSVVDWARNTYNPSLLRSYALFYVVGTALATRVPPVGMAPFRSLEQLGALVVLLFLCGQALSEKQRQRVGVERFAKHGVALLVRSYTAFFVVVVVAGFCAPDGFIKPLSIHAYRVFRNIPRTGNPLVDTALAEDASSLDVAWQLLHFPFFGWMIGVSVFLTALIEQYTYAKSFLMLYGIVGLYFSTQTIRMIVMVAPAGCIFTAVVVQWCLSFAQAGLFWPELPPGEAKKEADATLSAEEQEAALKKTKDDWTAKNSKKFMLHMLPLMVVVFLVRISGFAEDISQMISHFSSPGIVFRTPPESGWSVDMIDDYYKGFVWLRDNTPEDARVLGWFDYGYQITGIGNRTSLADGNTWNHEHIATIGKMLTSPVAEAHSLVRHMADYVLIFAGDTLFSDVDRSPLLARMANSVYHDICPNDPLCRKFGFQKKQKTPLKRRSRHMLISEAAESEAAVEYEPTPLLARSLLYHLHANGTKEDVTLDGNLFQLAFVSENGLVRIYKVMNVSEESKRWIADPAHRVCNPPGSWICPGQYPPAKEIQDMLAHQHSNFQDLVDAYEEVKLEEALNQEYTDAGGDL